MGFRLEGVAGVSTADGAAPRAHGQADAVERGVVEQACGHRQQFGLFARDVLFVQVRRRPARRAAASVAAAPLATCSSTAAQSAPTLFERAVVGRQRRGQFAQAHRVRAGHGLEQCREEVVLFILVVVARGGVEIAHHGDGGLARLRGPRRALPDAAPGAAGSGTGVARAGGRPPASPAGPRSRRRARSGRERSGSWWASWPSAARRGRLGRPRPGLGVPPRRWLPPACGPLAPARFALRPLAGRDATMSASVAPSSALK